MTAPLVEARAVARRFGARAALVDVSFAVNAGETLALAGANGAGKSTLLGLIAGALRPTSGSICVGGRVGYVPQYVALWRRLTVRENLLLLSRLEGCGGVDALIDSAGLADIADRPVRELSVGQAQRANIAVGLLGGPAVLLLDEPTAALDPHQRRRAFDLALRVAASGGAVVFTTQNMEEIPRHADRVLVLHAGAVVYDGATDVDIGGLIEGASS